MKINIGIGENERKEVSSALTRVMADTYFLYFKTHAFHWNVTGAYFQHFHTMFETQYNELWLALDLLAERIRSLGMPAPMNSSELSRITTIKEATGNLNAMTMVQDLLEGNEACVRAIRDAISIVEKAGDEGSADLLTTRLEAHEKTAWMLRATVQN
jgi:starvation-inducible DNA-binding protein